MRDIDTLALVIQTPGCLSPIVWGAPGIGKTSQINQIARDLNAHHETVIASLRDPSDFGGLPVPENGHGVRLEAPGWAHRLADACKDGRLGLGFFDEANTAPPAVQAAMLRVFLEGVVGDLALPRSVRFVAAANPPDQAAGGWELALPLANRFVHLKWESPDVTSWCSWLTGTGEAERPVPRLDLVAWETQFGQAKSLVEAFLTRRPALLNEDPSKANGRFPLAYATPRSWECATRLLATCRTVNSQELVLTLLTGAVGEPIALEFAAWLRENDLPDPEELLRHPESWDPDKRYPDRVFATCLAVAQAVIPPQNGKSTRCRPDRWIAAFRVLDRAMLVGKDIVVLAVKRLVVSKVRPEGKLADPVVARVATSLREIVNMAGLQAE